MNENNVNEINVKSGTGVCDPTGFIQITPLATDCCDILGLHCKGYLGITGHGTCVMAPQQVPCNVCFDVSLWKWDGTNWNLYGGGSNNPFGPIGTWCQNKTVECNANYSFNITINCFIDNLEAGTFKVNANLYKGSCNNKGVNIASQNCEFTFP